MQQFLLPDQTPPILEAEMSLRAEQGDGSGGRTLTPDAQNAEARQEVKTQQHRRSEERRTTTGTEQEEDRMEAREQTEERQQPEGRQAPAILPPRPDDRGQVGRWPGVRLCFL